MSAHCNNKTNFGPHVLGHATMSWKASLVDGPEFMNFVIIFTISIRHVNQQDLTGAGALVKVRP